ncbi:SAM-dependent methyltransferase [Lapidilactobacillus salsurivasis]
MDYLKNIDHLARRYATIIDIQLQVAEIRRCCAELQSGQLLSRPLPPLRLTESIWWQMVTVAENQSLSLTVAQHDFQQLDHLLHHFRKYLQYHFGQWTLISQQALTIWTRQWPWRRYLEVMAGDGRLAAALAARGQQVIATDSFSWQGENLTGRQTFYPVQRLTATAAVAQYAQQVDAVILSWSPNNDPTDLLLWQQLQQLPAARRPQLLVLGEVFGVTNSLLFWQQVPHHFSAPAQLISRYLPATSDGLREQLRVY